jgi:hypothetical protein
LCSIIRGTKQHQQGVEPICLILTSPASKASELITTTEGSDLIPHIHPLMGKVEWSIINMK